MKISLIKTGHLGSNVIPRCVLFHPRRWRWTHLFVAYYATCATVAYCGIPPQYCATVASCRQTCPRRSSDNNDWLSKVIIKNYLTRPRLSSSMWALAERGIRTCNHFWSVRSSRIHHSNETDGANHIAIDSYVVSAIGFIWMMNSWWSHRSKVVTGSNPTFGKRSHRWW